jgi:hypothetical protein
MEHLFFNEEWNMNEQKTEQKGHNVGSITDYHARIDNSIYYKSKDTLRDLYFFE